MLHSHPLLPSLPAWLPSLEKELNGLEPHPQFRLWLTTETHPHFPPILLQSSLKLTHEAPPGVKRNLMRTYQSWSQEFIERGRSVVRSQALFALAWFHAVVQERRMLIPQGWSKFYEFSLADLRAGTSIVERLCSVPGVGMCRVGLPWACVCMRVYSCMCVFVCVCSLSLFFIFHGKRDVQVSCIALL